MILGLIFIVNSIIFEGDFEKKIEGVTLRFLYTTHIRGGGSYSKLGAQNHLEAQKVGAQNLYFPYLRLKKWVRKCAPLRIRLHRPWMISRILSVFL